jgi:protein SCO1
VVTFGFTSCSDVCPLLAANLTVIQTGLANEDRARTGFLFITTDPEYDRAAVLREYGIKLGADFSNWKFLTSDLEALRPVWGGFGVSVRKLGPGHVDHTTLTTVVDREGIRRVNYYGTRWRRETVMGDILAWAHDEVQKL